MCQDIRREPEQSFKSLTLLHGSDLRKSGFSFFNSLQANHFAECIDSSSPKNICSGARQSTDTLSAKLSGTFCVSQVSVFVLTPSFLYLSASFIILPKYPELGICRNSRNYAVIDVACENRREKVRHLSWNSFSCENKAFIFFIHLDVTASRNTACTHSACNNSCVRCLASADGKNTLSVFHTFNILRRGFKTYKDNLFAPFLLFDYGILCGKYYFTCGCTGDAAIPLPIILFLSASFRAFVSKVG